jgi:hypothetical protein
VGRLLLVLSIAGLSVSGLSCGAPDTAVLTALAATTASARAASSATAIPEATPVASAGGGLRPTKRVCSGGTNPEVVEISIQDGRIQSGTHQTGLTTMVVVFGWSGPPPAIVDSGEAVHWVMFDAMAADLANAQREVWYFALRGATVEASDSPPETRGRRVLRLTCVGN